MITWIELIMIQGKQKLREDQDQPSIKDFYHTPKEKRTQSRRSRLSKRKGPPTPSSAKSQKPTKKQNIDYTMDTAVESKQTPDRVKHESGKDNVIPNIDNSIMKALEFLLKPIRDDIQNLCIELKKDLIDCKKLCEENVSLHHEVLQVESKNVELTKRVSELENKMLESSVIISGIQESPWETKAV